VGEAVFPAILSLVRLGVTGRDLGIDPFAA
jgi:hypothetical protein